MYIHLVFFSVLYETSFLRCSCCVRWNFIAGCMNTCYVAATLCYSSKVTNVRIAKFALCQFCMNRFCRCSALTTITLAVSYRLLERTSLQIIGHMCVWIQLLPRSSGARSEPKHHLLMRGVRGSSVVKVLCYKSKGRWFDHNWCHWNFSLT